MKDRFFNILERFVLPFRKSERLPKKSPKRRKSFERADHRNLLTAAPIDPNDTPSWTTYSILIRKYL